MKKKTVKPEVVYNNDVTCKGCGTHFTNKIANAEATVCPNCSRFTLLKKEKRK